jgi:hypothetical protein
MTDWIEHITHIDYCTNFNGMVPMDRVPFSFPSNGYIINTTKRVFYLVLTQSAYIENEGSYIKTEQNIYDFENTRLLDINKTKKNKKESFVDHFYIHFATSKGALTFELYKGTFLVDFV